MTRYEIYRKEGRCWGCGGLVMSEATHCFACAVKRSQRETQRRWALKVAGRCGRCSRRKALKGRRECRRCLKSRRQ